MIERYPCAKLNLSLAVVGKRDDGFHEIRSWVVKVEWTDQLTLSPAKGLSLKVESEDRSIPAGPDNLVWKAAKRLAEAAGRAPDVAIQLHKAVPAGAGLGGGSSDAAETLLGLNELWSLGWTPDRLAALGGQIGSDVPLFMMEGPVLMAGRGEVLSPLPMAWRGWALVIIPDFGLSTASVYASWAETKGKPQDLDTAALQSATTDSEILPLLFNDLESPAFSIEPRLQEIHKRIDGLDGRTVRMTGSGSALFTLFDERSAAESWKHRAAERMPPDTRFHIVRVL
ncbi:MAG: 4-(cytidine 5'-diphospho)-2-C-methyl-D-erythritol kinase [Planctomycetes bacterium]|nr:4-(cytidine 5'-diphospho)-2-C-methyl-D-erythritol kinase [Planctomycetota bacterium]